MDGFGSKPNFKGDFKTMENEHLVIHDSCIFYCWIDVQNVVLRQWQIRECFNLLRFFWEWPCMGSYGTSSHPLKCIHVHHIYISSWLYLIEFIIIARLLFIISLIAFLHIVVWHMRVSTRLLEVTWLESVK